MLNIAFRVDGGKNVGLGHIVRCLSLAHAFRQNGHKVYFLSKLKEGIEKAGQENFDVVRLSSVEQEIEGFFYGNSTQLVSEALEITSLLLTYQIDVLVLDTYNVSNEYFLALKEYVGSLVYIDDVNKFTYPVDIIINGNITGEFLGYQKYDQRQVLLLGPKYNMIRDEFANIVPRDVKEKPEEIMITTGGADPYRLTDKLLVILLKKDEYRHIRFNVLVGSSFIDCGYLDNLSKNYGNVFLYANSDLSYKLPSIIQSEISAIMLRSDLAISAGGSTLYELAACGTPALSVILADNQEGIVRKMDELGYVMNLGWYNQLNKDLVLDKLREMIDDFPRRREMSAKGQRLVDGKGVERIVWSILQNLEDN
ncbi:UDP-2,4-diacetamido-2,4,6-trideoxy-beta-L-altropyranose hydrolase [Desulfosporosinus lacus]|uniref:UDP-2,4-diacetamido-2,4,6-trideoxy-beta-L-altropyranose hydrolase n=1 Tax=Desulfosporosinus lacus DSM 15449 TaxID=1121420 RepID=A0A1M5UW56_9FIRM|nr:UDP-2,4-diacetamido-2,4,6-trideoxy-beta-L-altropyranose hydrolase [Desulfosporosinus lacus]SHH67212.1 UDP-2,4-diacetamido-2,4,6-trideoxy-beta-L-altropyranose hydrolase [Desulfosporosinus lacus DSM 15449]